MKNRIDLIRVILLVLALVSMLSPSHALASPPTQNGGPKAEADKLFQEGNELFDAGQLRAALMKFEEALLSYQKAGSRSEEVICLLYIGVTKERLLDYRGAIDAYVASFPLLNYVNNITQWTILNNVGLDYRRLGQYQSALQNYQQALEIAKGFDDPAAKGKTLNNIGAVYIAIGQFEAAINTFEQAMPFREKGSQGEVLTLNNIGEAYRNLGEYDEALKYYDQALTGAKEFEDQNLKGLIFNNIGLTYNELGEYQPALGYYQQALDTHKETGNRAEEATTLNNLGKISYEMGQDKQAMSYLQEALAIQTELGDRAKEEIALTNLGILYEKREDITQAIDYYEQAVDVLESIQGEIKIEDLKSSFMANTLDSYKALTGLLWNEGRFEEAFNYVERARARAFLDELAGGIIDFRAGTDTHFLERERKLRDEIAGIRSQLGILRDGPQSNWDTQAIVNAQAELDEREADLTKLLTEIKLQSPEVASLVSVDVASLEDIQRLLDANTTLIEYFVLEDRTLVFIITKDSFETTAVDANQAELSQAIHDFRNFVSLRDPYPANLKQLYTWLIAPLKDKLKTPVLGIIPHGVLHYLPFAALTDGERYLGDDYSLFTLPSASTLRFIHKKPRSVANTILALGNPTVREPGLAPLQFAQKEVEDITNLFGTEPLTGDAATESAFLSRANGAGIIHLAAHGKYDLSNPLFSVIYLAPDKEEDGLLEVNEIYSLDLTKATDLVVLSACETQVGDVSAGDEVVGMTRAFLYAGTPSVIASLWKVDDEATTLLMERFYRHLREGSGKADALQQAQRETRAQYSHPYYWAAFVLTGDPGTAVAGNWLQFSAANNRIRWIVLAISVLLLLLASGTILISKQRGKIIR